MLIRGCGLLSLWSPAKIREKKLKRGKRSRKKKRAVQQQTTFEQLRAKSDVGIVDH